MYEDGCIYGGRARESTYRLLQHNMKSRHETACPFSEEEVSPSRKEKDKGQPSARTTLLKTNITRGSSRPCRGADDRSLALVGHDQSPRCRGCVKRDIATFDRDASLPVCTKVCLRSAYPKAG